jgi:hypothetical protein
MGVKDSHEIVAATESREDRSEDKGAHGGEEIIIRMAPNVMDVEAAGRRGG